MILAIGLGNEKKSAAPSASAGGEGASAAVAIDAGAETASGAEVGDTGSLEIVSQPAGATVFVDGVERGKTPVVIAEVAAGIHEIKITKDGHIDLVVKKSVRAGRDETVSAMLAAATVAPPVRGVRPGRGTGGGGSSGSAKQPDPPKQSDPPRQADPPRQSDPPRQTGPRNPYDDDPDKKKNPYD